MSIVATTLVASDTTGEICPHTRSPAYRPPVYPTAKGSVLSEGAYVHGINVLMAPET